MATNIVRLNRRGSHESPKCKRTFTGNLPNALRLVREYLDTTDITDRLAYGLVAPAASADLPCALEPPEATQPRTFEKIGEPVVTAGALRPLEEASDGVRVDDRGILADAPATRVGGT